MADHSRDARDRKRALLLAAILAFVGTLSPGATRAASHEVIGRMACSLGGGERPFRATVTMPDAVQEGATFTVRIDSRPSGKLSQFGLEALHDMRTDYALSNSAQYVEGSLRFVPGTGTSNANAEASTWHDASGVHVLLAGRIPKGAEYTPPSIEFQARAAGAPGSPIVLSFLHYEVTANAFLLGDLHCRCRPIPGPQAIGTTRIVPAQSAP